MGLSIHGSSFSGFPLSRRGPAHSPSWPHPAPNTRPLLIHTGQGNLSPPTSAPRVCPGLQSTLITSSCSWKQASFASASFQWPAQCLWHPWGQAKSSQTFAVEDHTMGDFPAPNTPKWGSTRLVDWPDATLPSIQSSQVQGKHNPENQSLHALLSRFSCARHFATLWTIAHQAPPSMGFSRQEYWSGLPCPPPGDLPDPGVKPTSLMSPTLAGEFFTTSAT